MTAESVPNPLALVPQTPWIAPPDLPQPLATHEAELISALLESGSYNPRAYGVPATAFRGYPALHDFCIGYQEKAGCAPPVSLVKTRFPSFTYVAGLSASWAAHQLLEDEKDRFLRKTLSKALTAVGEEAYGEAIGIMREAVTTVASSSTPGRRVTDFSQTRLEDGRDVCPIPEGHLADLTGGHGAGHVWLVAALWGVGKTFKLVEHGTVAAEAGWDVIVFSMEMPTEDVLSRFRQQALRHLGPLQMVSLDDQEKAMHEWSEGAGTIEVRGPDTGRVDASTVASAVNSDKTLVIVDYIGKMFSTDGRHAKSGHDVITLISAELQQTAGLLKVPILGAAQINRAGSLAGAISLEQDADLILHQQRISDSVNSVRKNTIYKTRHTELPPPWYSRFDPMNGRFDDITHEEALKMRMAEESSAWS